MTKEQIQKEIEGMDSYLPVSKIEEILKMPPTTLQKVLSGKRELPKKWYKVLQAYFVTKPEKKEPAQKNTESTKNMSKIERMLWESEQEVLKQSKK